MAGVLAGVIRHGADRRNECIQICALATAKALQQAGAAKPEHGGANGAVGGWQQQGSTVFEQLHQNAAGADHQGQTEVVFALDADDQLGQGCARHRLKQDLIEWHGGGIGGNVFAHLLQRGSQGLIIRQVECYGARFGLVRQLRADGLEHQWVANRCASLERVIHATQHAGGNGQAERV
ncbi:hypothetical protein D3C77_548540 [compost metagenome]